MPELACRRRELRCVRLAEPDFLQKKRFPGRHLRCSSSLPGGLWEHARVRQGQTPGGRYRAAQRMRRRACRYPADTVSERAKPAGRDGYERCGQAARRKQKAGVHLLLPCDAAGAGFSMQRATPADGEALWSIFRHRADRLPLPHGDRWALINRLSGKVSRQTSRSQECTGHGTERYTILGKEMARPRPGPHASGALYGRLAQGDDHPQHAQQHMHR